MSTPSADYYELVLESIAEVQHAAVLVENLVRAVRKTPTDPFEITLRLSELLAETVEELVWDEYVYEAVGECTAVRPTGPLDLGGEFVWSSAAAAVADLVTRVDQAVAQHAPFGEAVVGFNLEYERLTRHVAISLGRTTEEASGDAVPPRDRVKVLPLDPARDVVLRVGWASGRGDVPEAIRDHTIWGAVERVSRVWGTSRRALGKLLAFQRAHLAALPLPRIFAELEWEAARVARVAQPAQGPGARPVRPPHERQDARDKWLYEQVTGVNQTYKAVLLKLRRTAATNGWRPLSSIEGVRKAATRYAETNQLPLPCPRL